MKIEEAVTHIAEDARLRCQDTQRRVQDPVAYPPSEGFKTIYSIQDLVGLGQFFKPKG